MSVRILSLTPAELPPDPVKAHLAMANFNWRNEQTGKGGETSRVGMYDWIVNKKGQAYIKNAAGETIYIFGAVDKESGQTYIRAAENGMWSNALIDLNKQTALPSDASR